MNAPSIVYRPPTISTDTPKKALSHRSFAAHVCRVSCIYVLYQVVSSNRAHAALCCVYIASNDDDEFFVNFLGVDGVSRAGGFELITFLGFSHTQEAIIKMWNIITH